MARNKDNIRRIHLAAQRKYAERLRLEQAPTSTDVARAISHAMRDRARAHFVNTEARAAITDILECAHDLLVAKGFRKKEVRRRLALVLAPVVKPMAVEGDANNAERVRLVEIKAEMMGSRK